MHRYGSTKSVIGVRTLLFTSRISAGVAPQRLRCGRLQVTLALANARDEVQLVASGIGS